MKKEHQQFLFDTYPGLYSERHLDMSQTCMCWGITTGDGWYEILRKASQEITEVIERKKLDPRLYCFTQVKEKLGELRIYISRSDEDIQQVIYRATEASMTTCEDCGRPGLMYREGWLRTSCQKCQREWRKRTKRLDPPDEVDEPDSPIEVDEADDDEKVEGKLDKFLSRVKAKLPIGKSS